MVKAEIILKGGAKMIIEGSPEEILEIKSKMEGEDINKKIAKEVSQPRKKGIRKSGIGPKSRILELIDEDFFKEKRSINNVQQKLEEKGSIYDLSSLSPALLRLVRKKLIRRIKEGKKWIYVNV